MGWIDVFLPSLALAVACFVALWPLSVWLEDASIVDFIWGPGFFLQVGLFAILHESLDLRGWILLGLVAIWSLRLGVTLAARRFREGHEDARYQSIRASWGQGFWWKSFFIVFVLQAVLQWLIAIGPMAGIAASSAPVGWIGAAGIAIAAAGLALESIADRQLDRFKAYATRGALMTTGLRAYVRHPNYTGEILFWSGIALISVEAGAWLGLISPILITFFLTQVSGAPLIDERLEATRPAYAAYRARVPGFLPSARQLRRA